MNDALYHHWLVEGRIRLVTLKHNLSAATLLAYDWETITLMDRMSTPLHVIVDTRELQSFPSLSDCLHVEHIRHPRMGYMLTIGVNRNRMMRFFLNSIGRATRVHFQDFETPEGAIFYLQQHALLSHNYSLV